MKRMIALGLMLGMTALAASASIEIRGSYLSPSDSSIKSIYGGGPMFGAELAFRIGGGLDLWLGGDYFAKTGKLTFTQEDTKLTLIPVGAGLRYRFSAGRVEPYVGVGARYYLYKESNPIGDVSKGGIGFIGRVGANLMISPKVFADVFAGYSFGKMTPADFEVGVGGLELGAGLGFVF
jgi:hypothetical protein